MYTECPICRTIYRLSPPVIEHAQGVVKCRRCGEVFDSLATFRTHPYLHEDPVLEPTAREPRPVPVGDRIILVHRIGLARPASSARPERISEPEPLSLPPLEDQPEPESSKTPARPARISSLALLSGNLGLALRNIVRHRRRSALAIAAIGFGVVALIQAAGFIEWIFQAMREDAIHAHLGHIQVTVPGYSEEGTSEPFAYLLPAGAPERQEIEALAHVRTVAPRLAFNGLISIGDTTVSFLGEGVDPHREETVSRRVTIVEGGNLSSIDAREIILGAGLAENLGASPGDDLVLLVTPASGGMNAVEVRVTGIFRTASKAFDDVAVRIPFAVATDLMQVSGAHRWVVLLEETEQTNETLAYLRARFPSEAHRLQFTPWYELAEFYNKTRVLFGRQVNVVQLIIAVIIVLSISNTLIMSVVERTGEIGTLMALGLRRRKILQLFVGEGVLLAIIGASLGLALGVGLARLISSVGIPMPPPPGMAVGFTGEILVTWPLAAVAVATAVAATTLASVYPSWKASRLEIVDALRHNR